MSIVDFVERLLSILKNEPQVVQWISEGKEFQIVDPEAFTSRVLKTYFRHNKFESFIRQLNMYGFHKVNRRKNSLIFQHEHFIKDKEENYSLIKRSKKSVYESQPKCSKSAQIHIDTELLSQKAPKLAELLQKLIEFNTRNDFDFKKLKHKLDTLSKQVSAKKQRILRPIIKNIRMKIMMLDEIQKSISSTNWNALNSCHQDLPVRGAQDELYEKQKKIKSAPVFDLRGKEDGVEQVSLNHLCSFKSISSFIAFG